MPDYVVRAGDCMESIAAEFGLDWEKAWGHPQNSELREQRQDPNVLLPGDIVFVPQRELLIVPSATDQLHRFERDTSVSKLALVLKEFDLPRANEPYTLTVDGKIVSGATDSNGRLEARITPQARRARLLVGKPEVQEEYFLELGHIDPIEEKSGVKGRLGNLGFESIEEFQKKQHLEATGEPDETTLARLQGEYGC
jgi:hypothetical protein